MALTSSREDGRDREHRRGAAGGGRGGDGRHGTHPRPHPQDHRRTGCHQAAAAHLSAHGEADRRRQGGPAPSGARGEGREHARGLPARGTRQGGHRLRGGGRGRHHAVRGDLRLRDGPAGRSGAQRPHHRSEDPAAVRIATPSGILGSLRPGPAPREAGGRGGDGGRRARRGFRPGRLAAGAAQPVRRHDEAVGGGQEAREARGPAPARVHLFLGRALAQPQGTLGHHRVLESGHGGLAVAGCPLRALPERPAR